MPLKKIVITDESTGSSARITSGFGMNCYQFTANCQGDAVDVLWSESDFESGQCRPSGSGIPILFPFPGRIQGIVLRHEEREYPLYEGDGQGNAIHGFVLDRPWRIVEQSANSLTGEFQSSVDDPALLDRWPADFLIRLTYQLIGSSLSITTLVVNPDNKPLPFGFGLHPYFRVPLGDFVTPDDCRITVPTTQYWELDGMICTGRKLPADEMVGLRQGVRFGELQVDDVFSGLLFEEGKCSPRIEDPASGRSVTISFGEEFSTCVVYNPPHREAICIEPYTCVPDPFRLEQSGVDSGLLWLAPGESFNSRVVIRVD